MQKNWFNFRLLRIFFLFEGQCCALYDKGLGRIVEDYNRLCAECPVQYESDDYEKSRTFFFVFLETVSTLVNLLINIYAFDYYFSFIVRRIK